MLLRAGNVIPHEVLDSLREVMDRFAVQLLPLLHHDRQAATPAVDIVFAVLDQGVDTQAAFGDAALALGVTEGEGGSGGRDNFET